MKLNKKGFTLIELMIVVAIIGILAAVAVPGFMRYIKDSKKSEARTNLDAIKTGAVSFYEAEHYSDDGLNSVTKVYPPATSNKLKGAGGKEFTIPGTASTSGVVGDYSVVGAKTSPDSSDVKAELEKLPWSALKFRISAPFYYAYKYTSAPTSGSSTFNAVAAASLSASCDSAFTIKGVATGTVGAIVEAKDSEGGTCPFTTVSSEEEEETTTTDP